MFKDYYQILEISQYASLSEIKEAYKIASKKWHPDVNQNIDTTQMMQDINEAYAILKDETKRARYDAEYIEFNRQKKNEHQSSASKTTENTWSYNYDVKDENLRQDINNARQYAKDLVDEFFASLRNDSKRAAKGAWDGAKGYVYVGVLFAIIGLVVALCSSHYDSDVGDSDEIKIVKPEVQVSNNSSDIRNNTEQYQAPSDWTKYEIDGSFFISVPTTVELRHQDDVYTKQLDDMRLNINKDVVIFQQKNLSKGANDNHYCRIIFQHFVGNREDFLRSKEQEFLGPEWQQSLTEMVTNELAGNQTLVGKPTFRWIDVNENTKAIEVAYRRTGNNNNTTHVTIYLLQNYNEMVKMLVSYREQEKDMWLPDLNNVIKTFKWNNLY